MASNQTEHYGLSQWALTDDVRMADFNADNAKIDAALAGRYGPGNPGLVTGGYTGDGSDTGQEIVLGFRPKAVFIIGTRLSFGMAIDVDGTVTSLSSYKTDGDCLCFIANRLYITDNGFTVVNLYTSHEKSLNEDGHTYQYLAVK